MPIEQARELLALKSTDIILPRLLTNDDMGDPIDWVKKYLKIAMGEE